MKTARTSGPVRRSRAVAVVAAGFDEEAVTACLTHLRAAGVESSLVSLAAGLVEGEHGLVMRPDRSLENELTLSPPRLLILIGGPACATALMADPRVHQLISNTVQAEGRIAATARGVPIVRRAILWRSAMSPPLIAQGDLELGIFTDQLIREVAW
jgi:putative intracellular protease/amidase